MAGVYRKVDDDFRTGFRNRFSTGSVNYDQAREQFGNEIIDEILALK